jgi:CheY-like chemotaxis protein
MRPVTLIVDDLPQLRDALSRLLRTEGYEPVAVASTRQALDYLRENTPDLVITDAIMAGKSGLVLFEEIHKDARLWDVPVIVFSAGGPEVREAALSAGVDAYVAKDSMDWGMLRKEIIRLVGPGLPVERTGQSC